MTNSQSKDSLDVGSRCHFIFACFLVAAMATAGCRKDDRRAEAQAEADRQVAELRRTAKWDEQQTGFTPESVAVAQGRTPLVHLFDIGGPIRVVDLATKAPLVSATVPDRTLVRVDDRNGVTVGRDNLVPGPLPAGRTYVIYLDPSTPNVMRQGIGPAREFQPVQP